jgi:hypothetical protein
MVSLKRCISRAGFPPELGSRALAGALDERGADRAGAAADGEMVVERDAGVAAGIHHIAGEDAEAFLPKQREGAGGGVEGADGAFDLGGASGEIECGFGLVDLVRVGDALGGLRLGGERVAGQRFDDQLRAHRSEFVGQRSSGLGVHGRLGGEQHRAGIEPAFHLHDGDAG